MSKKTRTALLIFFIIVITIISGWLYLSATKGTHNANDTQTATPKTSGYIFSRPSNGPLTTTHKITVTYNGNQATAKTSLDSKNISQKIKTGQDVILLDKKNRIMPLGGKVINIEQTDTHLEILIDLPTQANTSYLSNEAEIITSKTIASQRYPLSALQQGDNGKQFVWVVEKSIDSEKHTIVKTLTTPRYIGRGHFIVSPPLNSNSFVILNPDNKLKGGKVNNITETKFEGPSQSPIQQAYQRYKLSQYQHQIKKLKDKGTDCRENGASRIAGIKETIENSPNTGSCSSNEQSANRSAEDIFNSILNRQPGGGATCGNTSCGQ